jgi:hypothetical protein
MPDSCVRAQRRSDGVCGWQNAGATRSPTSTAVCVPWMPDPGLVRAGLRNQELPAETLQLERS